MSELQKQRTAESVKEFHRRGRKAQSPEYQKWLEAPAKKENARKQAEVYRASPKFKADIDNPISKLKRRIGVYERCARLAREANSKVKYRHWKNCIRKLRAELEAVS